MKGIITIRCDQCEAVLKAQILFDTADDQMDMGRRLQYELLKHRDSCPYGPSGRRPIYSQEDDGAPD